MGSGTFSLFKVSILASSGGEDNIGWSLLLIFFLLAINGFFVAMEFALVAARKTKIDEMVAANVAGAEVVQEAKEQVDDYVATAQLGITVASLALGMVAEKTVIAIFQPFFQKYLNITLDHEGGLGFVLSITLVTIFHVVIGEQVPKMLAINLPNRVALLTVPPSRLVLIACRPFIQLLSWMTTVCLRFLGLSNEGGHHVPVHSEEEILAILSSREEAGLSDELEGDLVSNVFHLFDLVATQIMVPRTELICIQKDMTISEALDIANQEGFARYPIFGDNLDDIEGVLLIKDLIMATKEETVQQSDTVAQFARPAVFLPGSVTSIRIFQEMQKKNTKSVIILDEYGGTAGMVSIADLLHYLVGDVKEEQAVSERENIEPLKDGCFSVSGLVLVEDIEDFFRIEISDDHNDTIGGVIFSKLDRRPELGDEVDIENYIFRIEHLDGNRIDRITVIPPAEAEEQDSVADQKETNADDGKDTAIMPKA